MDARFAEHTPTPSSEMGNLFHDIPEIIEDDEPPPPPTSQAPPADHTNTPPPPPPKSTPPKAPPQATLVDRDDTTGPFVEPDYDILEPPTPPAHARNSHPRPKAPPIPRTRLVPAVDRGPVRAPDPFRPPTQANLVPVTPDARYPTTITFQSCGRDELDWYEENAIFLDCQRFHDPHQDITFPFSGLHGSPRTPPTPSPQQLIL